MKVYISGKIGEEVISAATRKKFARAEKMLQERGYETFNPTDERFGMLIRAHIIKERSWYASMGAEYTGEKAYEYALFEDLQKLRGCGGIYMLEDWKDSPGAKAELYFAMATGKALFWESEEDMRMFCDDAGNYKGTWLPTEG